MTMRTFSVAEAAKEMGVSVGTIYGLCATRKLRHERIGLGRGKIRIPEDAITEYRRSVTIDAEPTPIPSSVKLKHLSL
jgi:excisionase family DNA binding protein